MSQNQSYYGTNNSPLKATQPKIVQQRTKKELKSIVKRCLDISPAKLNDYEDEISKFPDESAFNQVMEDSEYRNACYHIANNTKSQDPAFFQVQGLKDVIDFEYLAEVNRKEAEKDGTFQINRLVKIMKERNSRQKIAELKEQAKNIKVAGKGGGVKKNAGSNIYQLSEKMRSIDNSDEPKAIHQKFKLLTQYLNEYKEKICQNSLTLNNALENVPFEVLLELDKQKQVNLGQLLASQNMTKLTDLIEMDFDTYSILKGSDGKKLNQKDCRITPEHQKHINRLLSGKYSKDVTQEELQEFEKSQRPSNSPYMIAKRQKLLIEAQKSVSQIEEQYGMTPEMKFKDKKQRTQSAQGHRYNRPLSSLQNFSQEKPQYLKFEDQEANYSLLLKQSKEYNETVMSNKHYSTKKKKILQNEKNLVDLYKSCKDEQNKSYDIKKQLEMMKRNYNGNLETVNSQLHITKKQITAGQLKHRQFSNFLRK